MLTPKQRQQILEFCQEHEIIRLWTMDEPLLNAGLGAGRPSVIVTFRPYWVAVPEKFAWMERDLAAITGPETALYSTDGLSPRFVEQVLARIPTLLPDPDAPPVSAEAVAKFCRKHHIQKMWLYDAPLPNADCDDLKPSVIAATHPDYPMGADIFGLQKELQSLICVGATLYSYSGMVKPGIAPKELNEIAEVWYDESA